MDIRVTKRKSGFLSGLCRSFTWKKSCISLPSPVEKVLTDLAEKAETAVDKVEAELVEKVAEKVTEAAEKVKAEVVEAAEKVKAEVVEAAEKVKDEVVEKVKAVAASIPLPESEDDKEKVKSSA